MRILHLLADWKWTGPSEPVLQMVLALRARGHEVELACQAAPPEASTSLPAKARERGVEPWTGLSLRPGFHPVRLVADRAALAARLDALSPDLLNVHQSHDHLLGMLAAWRTSRRVAVVRTNHKGIPLPPDRGTRWLFRRTDGYLTFTPSGLARDIDALGLDPGRAFAIPVALDLERFDPAKADAAAGRAALGLGPGDVVVGIVARVQRHRKWQELLEGFALARKADPRLRLVVVGRGSHRAEAAEAPARAMGLGEAVVFAGYRGEDYLNVLATFDLKVFLVPGSDGTCRAVREAMAMGKPVIAARTGMLPDLVVDERTGIVVDPAPEALAAAIGRLARDPDLRTRFGKAGRAKALAAFRLDRQAEAVEMAYQAICGM